MKRDFLSGAALAALVAAPLWNGAPAFAQTSADQTPTTQADGKPIRRVGTDAWPTPKDEAKKPATTSTVTSDPLSIKTSTEVKDEKTTDSNTQATSTSSAPDNKTPANEQTAQPAASPAPAKTEASSTQPATTSTQTAVATSNASVRLGTDAEGRVAINAAQSRDISAALRSSGARPIEGVDIAIKAGTVVPSAIHLTAVSPAFVGVFPQFRGYSYFTTREEVVIVEPASKKIVALVSLKDTATASKPSGAKTTRVSNGDRVTTRRATRERVTTGASMRDDGGDLPPPGMVLRETTVTTANGTRTYRRLEPAGNDTVVIRRRAPRQMIELDTE